MKKIYLMAIAALTIAFFPIRSVQAASIYGNSPIVNITRLTIDVPIIGPQDVPASILDQLNTDINTNIETSFNTALDEANNELGKYENQKDLAKGFGNANSYAGHVATQQGYQDYSLFAFTSGIMAGLQAPSSDPDYYDEDTIEDDLKDDGDIFDDVGVGVSMFNVGINTSFIYPGLYLNLKFGSLTVEPTDELTVKNSMFGVGANYSWIRTKSLLVGLIKWRGISFGTGFIYNNSKVDYELEIDPEIQQFELENVSIPTPINQNVTLSGNVVVDPSFTLGFETTTVTIPFDVTTSIRLLWLLNLNFGAGIDLNFGSTDIILEANGVASIDQLESSVGDLEYDFSSARVTVDGSTKVVKPSLVRPRITTGIGLNLWALKIDVPIIYYPKSGVAVGVTAGIVW